MRRIIFLVDMNAFFISCESTRHPEIIGKPAAVAGDPKNRAGIILTANYEARKFGVKTTMVLHKALELCPNMIIIPPDHKFYKRKSKEVMDILSEYTPVIEQNSIDEAWLDMTGCQGIFGSPYESAKRIMKHINNKLGLKCSIGISENKFLAKMASEMKKPLGITELWKKDIELKLWPLPVQFMHGVGKQTTQKLHKMGVKTIGELALSDRRYIAKKLGKIGAEICQLANGIDISQIKPRSQNDLKSIGKSIILSRDISDIDSAKIVLMKLSDEVGMAARRYDKKGRTVQINIKYSNFQCITRQTTVPATYLVQEIYSAGVKMLCKSWNRQLPVRLLGISLSGFDRDNNNEQISIFNMLETVNEKNDLDKIDKIETTINNIRQKYGSSIINRGILMKKGNKN
ncbi:DNA polymerase IV [Clostridium sp. WILCCON 0269]|uniref:DNA polymerase IV n=1 Tax=Candidatus Clostridium eludens TaxID=3381663 RepID=A0ABW8SNC5_9CLOT